MAMVNNQMVIRWWYDISNHETLASHWEAVRLKSLPPAVAKQWVTEPGGTTPGKLGDLLNLPWNILKSLAFSDVGLNISRIIWVCLKMLAKPLKPMVLLIIIPFLNGYFIGKINPTFSGSNPYTNHILYYIYTNQHYNQILSYTIIIIIDPFLNRNASHVGWVALPTSQRHLRSSAVLPWAPQLVVVPGSPNRWPQRIRFWELSFDVLKNSF